MLRHTLPVRKVFQPYQRRTFLTVIQQYERGVKLNLGKYRSTLKPGLRLKIPIFHKISKVDMRDRVQNLPHQEVITKDGVTCKVDAAIQYKVVNAEKSVLGVYKLGHAVSDRTQVSLREVLGENTVDDVLHQRGKLSSSIKDRLLHLEDEWGIDIDMIQIKDLTFDESMTRAMAKEAEAERTAKSKIIHAKADIVTAEQYEKAASIYNENPITMKLRELHLWQSVAKEKGNTLFIVPSDSLNAFRNKKE